MWGNLGKIEEIIQNEVSLGGSPTIKVTMEHIVDCLATKLWFTVVVWPEYYGARKVLSGCQSQSETQPNTSKEIEYMRCLTLYDYSLINAFRNHTWDEIYLKIFWAYPEKHQNLNRIWFSWRIGILICSEILTHQFMVIKYWLLHKRYQHLYILLS